MSTTLLPFLYQTRTLQGLSRTGVRTPAFRALLHGTARHDNPRGRRPQEPRKDYIPFELPEGYEFPEEEPGLGQDRESGGVRSTITPSERETFKRIFEEIAAKKTAVAAQPAPAAPPTPSAPPPPGDLSSPTSSAPGPVTPTSSGPPADIDDFSVRTQEPSRESIRNTINIIVQDAAAVHTSARRHLQKPFGPLHPLDQTSTAAEWEKAMLRFPPSLRKAARMALGTMEADKEAQKYARPPPITAEDMSKEKRLASQIDLVLDPLSKSVQNEVLRREERKRVEAKMHAAPTDFALWDVLEEEVFPMVEKLGIDSNKQALYEPRRKRGRKRKEEAAAAGEASRKGKLPMHIYGPLYPTYLLHALRLMDTQFARPSPLALNILPRVKELGPSSYVLGVSTPFYNELARIHWHRYGDPAAVFNLLEEMRHAGLYCDETTRGIVQSIEHFLGSAAQGKWGPFLRELATLPEYEFAILPRIRHWLTTINVHIYERMNELQG
ncbi:hypothetical protein VTK56DRAFT_2424 [Thermocarpiscus australiensis]